MAVRDEQQLKEPRRDLPWREMLSQAPAALVIGGLVVYGYLRLYLERFYGRLGIDPNDVGLTYADTLARSVSFLIACFIVFVAFRMVQVATHLAWPMYRTTTTSRFLAAVAVLMVLAFLAGLLRGGEVSAQAVQAGRPLTRAWLGFGGLVRADSATVEPVGKPGDSPAAERLRGRRLLYLGQAGGTVVLYDAAAQRAVYVPTSTVILHVANCRDKPPPDAAC